MAYERMKLPDTRRSVTHSFTIHAKDGKETVHLTVGMYPNGTVGEMFVKAKNPDLQGALNSTCKMFSVARQAGVELSVLCRHLAHERYQPAGFCTGEDRIKSCHSIMDYVARWLTLLDTERRQNEQA